jgi:subtilase family serine protease
VLALVAGAAMPAVGASATPVAVATRLPAGARFGAPLATSALLHFDVVLRPRDPGDLATLAAAVSTPGSSSYRRYLTRDQFAQRFGAPSAAIDTLTRSLRALGLGPGAPSANRLVVPVSGTVAAVQRAFGVRMRHVTMAHDPNAFSASTAAVVPASLVGNVQAIVGLTNVMKPQSFARPLPPHAPHRQLQPALQATPHVAGPAACSTVNTLAAGYVGSGHMYPNSDTVLDDYYGLSALYAGGNTGAGVTVALYELGGYTPADIAAFQSCYGTNATVNAVNVDGGPGAGYLTDYVSVSESELDIETVIGSAPNATVEVYQGPDVSSASVQNQLDVYNRIVSDDNAQVASISWGLCEHYLASEPDFVSAQNLLFEEAATQGQSILAAAGDTGSAGCIRSDSTIGSLYVNGPASSPWVTSVGGTENTAFASQYLAAKGTPFPAEEGAWNDGCFTGQVDSSCAGGGGGVSILAPRPSWQTGPGVDNPAYPNGGREVPDVSASADYNRYPYLLYDTDQLGGWSLDGGTSASSPLWAGVLALADARCASIGVGRVGFANPLLYADAAEHPGDFYDVSAASGAGIGTPANTDVTGANTGAYPATAGYDMATGLGTPRGPSLVNDLCQATAPASPWGVQAVSGPAVGRVGTLTVVFAAGADNDAPITHFTVTCASSNGGRTESVVLNGVVAPTNVYGVSTNRSYRCSVTATNQRGTSPPSAASPKVIIGAPAQPAPPAVSRIGKGHFKVSFATPAANGAPITTFKAVCESSDGGVARGKTGTKSPLGVKHLTRGKRYSCTVRATNRRGTGRESAPSRSRKA